MLLIKTKRLILRDFQAEDFDPFFKTSNDPEYQKFYSERENSREFWDQIFQKIRTGALQEPRSNYQVAICLKTNVIIGTCGVRIEDWDHQQASFGCAIDKSYWGQDLAFEASLKIIDFAFSRLPVHRIYAETNSENQRARALLERLGMKMEGELHQYRFFRGRWWDTIIYSVLKPEWNERLENYQSYLE